jgi:polyferredoxin
MGKLGKDSLVQWSSNSEVTTGKKTKVFRTITYLYATAIIAIFAMLFVMGGTKEFMILDINKEARLYKVKAENEVTNGYLMLFKNTEPNKHTYKLEVVGKYADTLVIKRFKDTTLNAGGSTKDILILSAKDKMPEGNHQVTIKAYATDEPERVFLYKEVSFVYPPHDKLK